MWGIIEEFSHITDYLNLLHNPQQILCHNNFKLTPIGGQRRSFY